VPRELAALPLPPAFGIREQQVLPDLALDADLARDDLPESRTRSASLPDMSVISESAGSTERMPRACHGREHDQHGEHRRELDLKCQFHDV
jgi:hypothetical protein